MGNFSDEDIALAKEVQETYGVPASVTLAQYALESGYGKSLLASKIEVINTENENISKDNFNNDSYNEVLSESLTNQFEIDDKSNELLIKSGMTVSQMEKVLILETLKANGNNKTKAADMLGISIRTLRNKINEYNLS